MYVAQFGKGNIPCFDVEIGGNKFLFGLDLGLDADLSGTKETIRSIKEKSFVETIPMRGVRGGVFEENVYELSNFKLGRLTIAHRLIQEESDVWDDESAIIPNIDPSLLSIDGRIGWRLFKKITLFLDLKNGNIALAGSRDDFLRKGYSLNGFTKTALYLDRGFIEFMARIPRGTLSCILDSGCTSNLIHSDDLNHVPLEKLIVDESRFMRIDRFEIGENDCGPIVLRPVPIHFHVPVEAILGMEFLLNHRVFIDFPNQEIYFSTSD